ncbi:MAG TPA: hypothetical protein VLJ61_01740 [Pyrinomonadaceae bacterium]|nr:hypothetical protein [Pyrinomonadaceae bacterium]
MVVWTLLIVFFWAVVPGLITGWMRRERGRSFLPGLLVGVILGPLGILITLVLMYFYERRDARGRRAGGRGRAVRVFYDIPLVGRLHVSTVWALAGLATFLCLWMVGGIGYEFYRTSLQGEDSGGDAPATANSTNEKKAAEVNSPAVTPSAETKLTASAQANTSSQARAALLGSISAQPGQTMTGATRSGNSSTQTAQPASTDATGGAATGPPSESNSPASAPLPKSESGANASNAKATAPSHEAAISEVTQNLSASGHRVHAALSGDARTTTLSLTGATLTREVGNQLLGNRRLRESLKAAGVRIVVMVNGQESWTYML